MEGERISENVKKRRGSYLSYLSYPLLKVPRTSKHRQKLCKEDCASFEDKASENGCQTIDNNYVGYSDSSDQRDDICLKGFCRKKRHGLMPRTIWQIDLL